MKCLSAETKQHLIAAARKLLAERSYEQVRMDDIANEARVGKVTVFRYFTSKEQMFMDVLDAIWGETWAKIIAGESSVRGCRARLVACVRIACEGFDHRIGVKPEFLRLLQGLLAEGVVRGEFNVADLEVAVRAIVGGVRTQAMCPCVEVGAEEFPERLVGTVTQPIQRAKEAA